MTPEQLAILKATLAAQRDATKLDASALEALQQLYQQTADDIAQRIAAYAGADGNVELQSMQDLLTQVNARLKQLGEARDALLNQNLASAVAIGVSPLSVLGALATSMVQNDVVQLLRETVGPDGLQLSDRIWRLDRQARDLITNAVESAVIQGHGATQAARDLLARGAAVTADVAAKMGAGNAQALGKVTSELLTGVGSPMDNAMRVMRTEINRAHGTAYAIGFLKHPDAAGLRFMLSPGHPKPDICDLHASANLYGLGKGVYPDLQKCPWPAHPNTISFVVGVFKDEVTDADRAGKETVMQALGKLSPAQQIGALGKNKQAVITSGKLTPGMIAKPWSAVMQAVKGK